MNILKVSLALVLCLAAGPSALADRNLNASKYTKVPKLNAAERYFLESFEQKYQTDVWETVDRIRSDATEVIWKRPDLNLERMPDAIRTIEFVQGARKLPTSQILELSIQMPHGLVAKPHLLMPKSFNGDYIVYAAGHWPQGWIANKKIVRRFLRAGYGVAAISMPVTGENVSPLKLLTNSGPISFGGVPTFDHGQLAYLEAPNFSPLSLFMEPVLAVVNYLADRNPLARIAMTGESGGGWTTAVYAALDERIDVSVPVAGSLPNYAMRKIKNGPDFEYIYPPLLGAMNLLDAMVLASCNRTQLQVFHQFEEYFFGLVSRTYEGAVKRVVSKCGGSWELLITKKRKHGYGHGVAREMLNLLR